VKLRPSSVRVRLTLWYTSVLAAIVLVLSSGVFLFVRANLFRGLDQGLERDFAVISQVAAAEPNDIREAETEYSVELFRLIKDGRPFYETAAFRKAGLDSVEGLPPSGVRTVRSSAGGRLRLKAGPVSPGFFLVVAEDEEPARSALRTLLVILLLSFPAALALAAFGGSVMAGRLLKPVADLAARAEKISSESLSARLPVENPADEFGRLAVVVNRMLARLEDSFERLRRFTADASHELRTPLTVIQNVGEVALQEDLDPAAFRDRIGSMLEDVGRLTRLVDSLLTLTRADAGSVSIRRGKVDVTHLAGQAAEDMRPLAEEKGQSLSMAMDGAATVMADEATLRLAVVNLLDNAIKYTPAGGAVTVLSRVRGSEVVLEVTDSGPGIPPEHRDRIFDRFYRIDKDRTGRDGGAGLGLAITKWAVEANGGRIELDTGEGQGSSFRLVFPLFQNKDD